MTWADARSSLECNGQSVAIREANFGLWRPGTVASPASQSAERRRSIAAAKLGSARSASNRRHRPDERREAGLNFGLNLLSFSYLPKPQLLNEDNAPDQPGCGTELALLWRLE